MLSQEERHLAELPIITRFLRNGERKKQHVARLRMQTTTTDLVSLKLLRLALHTPETATKQ